MHKNTTEASDHAPQVAETFIGFSNSFFGKSLTGASLFDLTSIFVISVDSKYLCSEATCHGIATSPSRIPAGLGKLVRLADLEEGVHEAFFLFLLTTQMHFAIISGQH